MPSPSYPELNDPWARSAPVSLPRDARPSFRWLAAACTSFFGACLPLARFARPPARSWEYAAVLAMTLLGAALVCGAREAGRVHRGSSAAVVAVAVTLTIGDLGVRATLQAVVGTVFIGTAFVIVTRQPSGRTARPAVVATTGLVATAGLSTFAGSSAWRSLAPMAVAATVLLLSSFRPDAASRIQRRIVGAAHRAVDALGTVIVALLAAVTVILPGAASSLLRRAAARLRRPPSTFWIERPDTADRRRSQQDAKRPFIAASAGTRLRRAIGALLVIPAVGATTWFVARPQPLRLPDGAVAANTAPGDQSAIERGLEAIAQIESTPYSERPAFADAPWADEMQSELADYQFVDDPVTGYRSSTFASRYTNVTDAGRATSTSACTGCPSAVVWVVGGSTAFGLGQRDDHTIASELVKAGDREGLALDVRNLALPGWTLQQEVADMWRRIAESGAPDLVVFVDGFNDTAAAVFDRSFGRVETTGRLRAEDSARFLGGEGNDLDPAASAEAGRLAAARYRDLRDETIKQLEARSIRARFFFQPDAFSAPAQSEYLATYYRSTPDLLDRLDLGAALSVAAAELEPANTDLRSMMEDVRTPVFADMVHLNEAGAALVALAIYDSISRDLVDVATRSP